MEENLTCEECGNKIVYGEKFAKHESGTVLCMKCFQKLIKKGVIG